MVGTENDTAQDKYMGEQNELFWQESKLNVLK